MFSKDKSPKPISVSVLSKISISFKLDANIQSMSLSTKNLGGLNNIIEIRVYTKKCSFHISIENLS